MESQLANFPLVLIPLLPLAGAALNLLFGRRMGKGAGLLAVLTVAIAALFGWSAAYLLWQAGPEASIHQRFFAADWIHASEPGGLVLSVAPGLVLDRLSAVMVLVITTIGTLIHVYSTAYMEHDEGYTRFFAYLNLFTAAMLILVLGDSLVVTFVGWEGVGLCSYLLIGFWWTKDANAFAGRKAFIVNRVGDFGFLLGMFFVFTATSTFSYAELGQAHNLQALRETFHGPASYATMAGLLLFVGATGKSAQIPLYVWLPDAMAGPTPVSALIHAATMVTAGVYMIARLHFLFEIDPFVLAVIACVGAATALFAATMGITARPIKKILAYSTVSQLGFMFIGVGTATYTAGVFHLVTHAVFKAGLFLAAGSVMHGLDNEEDVLLMGGLRKKMPLTHVSYLAYCLAIAGIFPFAGFFSKDAILAGAYDFGHGPLFAQVPSWPQWLGHAIYFVGLAAAACTAFYMFRSYFLVFWGEYRGPQRTWDHAHESPPAMSYVLVLLAVGSLLVGFLGVPEVLGGHDRFAAWLTPAVFEPSELHLPAGTEWALMIVATLVSVIAAGLAFALYGRGVSRTAESLARGFGPLYQLVFRKYYVDELYDAAIVRPLKKASYFLWKVIDTFVIDLLFVRGSAIVVDVVGRLTRYLQTGDVQTGLVGVAIGTACILGVGRGYTAWRASEFTASSRGGGEIVVSARGVPSGLNRPLEYAFDFGDETPVIRQNAPTAVHKYETGGKHKVVVEVTDPRWHSSSRHSETINIAGGGGR